MVEGLKGDCMRLLVGALFNLLRLRVSERHDRQMRPKHTPKKYPWIMKLSIASKAFNAQKTLCNPPYHGLQN